LEADLRQMKQAADNVGASVLVTINADEQAKYQRMVDVLDALNAVKISNVSFQVGAPE